MPISNFGAPDSSGNSGQILSKGGYYLGDQSAQSGANDLLEAYRQLRRLQQQQTTNYSGQQQAQPQGPDTSNWRQMTDLEKGVHGLAEWGESISDPFGWGQKWQETKERQERGEANVGDYLETGARFVGSLIPGMVGGLAGDPEKVVEAFTGANLQESRDGKVSDVALTDEQRFGSGAQVGIDIASLIPGLGIEGTLAKGAAQLGKTAVKGVAEEAVEQGARQLGKGAANTSALEKLGGAVAKEHPFAAGLVTSSAGEAGEEFAQSFAEDVRGYGDQYGFANVTGDNFQRALDKATESAAFGALGGAVFHTANTGVNYGLNVLQNEAQKQAGLKAGRNADSLAAVNQMVTDAKNTYSNVDTPVKQYDSAKDNQVATVIARDIEKKQANQARRNLGYSGTMVGTARAYGNYMVPSAANVMATVSNNSTRDTVLNQIFGKEDGEYARQRSAFIDACARNDAEAGLDLLNMVAADRDAKGDRIEVLFYKQPATNETPIKGWVREFSADPNQIGVDESIAAIANADYDGDLGAAMFDPEKISEAKLFTSSLLNGSGESIVKWGDADMDMGGWSDVSVDILRRDLEAEFGRDFADNVAYELPGADGSLSLKEALSHIASIEDKGERNAAESSLFMQMEQAGANVSRAWGYIQTQSRRQEAILAYTGGHRADIDNAVEKVANPENFPEHTEIQSSTDPGAYTAQNDPYHGMLTSLDMGKEAKQEKSSSFRNEARNVFRSQGTRGTYVFHAGDTGRQMTQYEALIMANLDMVAPGIHDNSKIMSLYNLVCREIMDEFSGGKFQIDRDFDPETAFSDELIDEINSQIGMYNSAIKEAFFGGEDLAKDGPFLKKRVTRETMAEFVYGIYKDDYTLAEIMEPLIANNRELESIDGIHENMGQYFKLTKGDSVDEMLKSQTTTGGRANKRIYKFVSDMKRASDSILDSQERKFTDFVSSLDLKDRDDLETVLRNVPEDQLAEYVEADQMKAFNMLGELLGSDVLIANGWARFGSFRESEDGKLFMYGSREDKLNVVWNAMFRTHTSKLFGRLASMNETGSTASAADVLAWMNGAIRNGNPIFQQVSGCIELWFAEYGIIEVEDGTVSLNQNAPEDKVKAAAAHCMKFLSSLADNDVTIGQKMEALDKSFTNNLTGENPGIPYFMWLRAGLESSIDDLGLSQKIAAATAVSSNPYTKNAEKMVGEIEGLDTYKKTRNITDDVAMDTLRAMASDMFVEVDPEVTYNELFDTFLAQRPAIEKAQSVEGVARSVEAKRIQYGLPFVTLFNQNTDSLGNAVKASEFCVTRRQILGCLFGETDPVTGEPFEVRVYDQEVDDYVVMNQETMLGLARDEKVTYAKVMDYLRAHPNVASWLKPMKIQLSRAGDNRSAGPRAVNKSLSACFEDTMNKVKTAYKSNTNWVTERYRKTVLDAAARIPNYNALILGTIESPESIRSPQQFRNAAADAKRQVDNWILYSVAHWDEQGFQDIRIQDLEASIDNRLDAIFQATRDEAVTNSLLSERVLSARRRLDKMQREQLLASYMQVVSPGLKMRDQDADLGKEAIEESAESIKLMLQDVTMNKLLISNGDKFDVVRHLKDTIGFDAIKDYFESDQDAKTAFDNLDFEALDRAMSGNILSSVNEMVLDEDSLLDGDTGMLLPENQVIEAIRKYACDNTFFNVEESFIRDEIAPKVSRMYEDPDANTAMEARGILAQVHRKAAVEYYRAEAARRNKVFDGANVSMMRTIEAGMIPQLRSIIRRKFDPQLLDNLDNVTVNEAPLPNIQWFNPVSSRLMLRSVDFQTSGDAQMRIGMEGQTPKFMSFIGFLKDHSCRQGRPYTVDQMGLLDLSDETRYTIVVDEHDAAQRSQMDAIAAVTQQEGSNRLDLTLSNYRALSSLSDVEPTLNFNVVDRNDQDACTSGLCCDHANGIIDFIQHTMAFGQESRTMKLKKVFRIIEDVVKGTVDKGTVVKPRHISEDISPARIASEYDRMIDAYQRSIKQNASANCLDTGFGMVDEDIDWAKWAVPFAKMMVPCVKVRFRNGDTCSVGIAALKAEDALRTGNVRDPLYRDGMTTHSELIDWDAVESVEMGILGAEELSSHVINAITRAEVDAAADGTEVDYAAVAEDAFVNWGQRSRYCQETNDTAGRLTADDIVNNIRFMSSSMYDPPMLNILPSTVERFLGSAKFTFPQQIKPRTMAADSYGITRAMVDDLKGIMPFDSDGNDYIGAVVTDKDSDKSDAFWLDKLGLLKANRAYKIARENGGFINGSTVLIDYGNFSAHRDAVRQCVLEAAECNAYVMVPNEGSLDMIMEAIGMPDNSTVATQRIAIDGHEFFRFRPYDLVKARNSYHNGVRMNISLGMGEPYRVFLDCPGYGPTEDSMIDLTEEQARNWHVAMEARDASFDLKNLGGKRATLLQDGADLDVLLGQVDSVLTESIFNPVDISERDNANRDLPAVAYEIFDFSGVPEEGSDISDKVMLQRIKAYLDKVESSGGDAGQIAYVHQGDVVAVARTGEDGNYRYYPVVYQGSVPVKADLVTVDFANGLVGSTVSYRYNYSTTLDQDGSIKLYCNDIDGVKAQAVNVADYSADLAFKDAKIPTSGFLHHASMGSRLTPTLEPQNVKLSMFVLLRQFITYNKFDGIDESNIDSFFDDTGGFDRREILEAVGNKTNKVGNVRFWRALAAGEVKLAGCTNAQQTAIGRMVLAFLNANTSPAFLFGSQRNGKADGTSSSDWSYVLSDISGVRLDDVMAFCNWVDSDFCFPDARRMGSEDFLDSGKFISSDGRAKIIVTGKNGTKRPVLSYVRVSRTTSNGATQVRGVSDSQSFNNQLQWLMLVRNGVHGCDPKAAMQGMRAYLAKFSSDEIADIYDADPDAFFKKLNDPYQFRHDMASYRPSYAYKAKSRSVRRDKWENDMIDFYNFYNNQRYPEVWDQANSETVDIDRYFQNYKAEYPKLSKELYMRLIMANINWTRVNSATASGRIPYRAFIEADNMIQQSIGKKNQLPIFAREVRLNDTTVRIGVGAVEPWFLHDLCNATGREYEAMEKQMLHNLDEAKKLVADLNTGTSERKIQETAIEYLEYAIKGETDTDFLNAGVSMKDLVSSVSKVYDYVTSSTVSDVARFEEHIRRNNERLDAIRKADDARNRIHVDNGNARFATLNRNRRTLEDVMGGVFEGAVKMRQAMAMAGAVIPVANMVDTMKGNAFQGLGNRLGQLGVGPSAHLWENAIDVSNDVIEAVIQDKNVQAVIEARKLASTMGPEELRAYNLFMENPENSASDYIKSHAGLKLSQPKDLPHKAYGMIMRFGSAARFNNKSTVRNFLQNFRKVAGNYGLTELNPDGPKSLERDLLSEQGAATAINKLFSEYSEAAEVAWNMTMPGSTAQESVMSWFGERITQNRSWMKFIGATVAGVPFFRATVNLTTRTLKNVIPGMSSMNYLMVNWLKENPSVFTGDNPFSRLLRRSCQVDGETLKREFAADADALKMYTDLREAIMVDLCHMTFPMFAAVLALSGAIQPPDDDDRYDDYEEWTVFGQRISLMWWMKDLVGPILPWACYYKAGMDGHPSSGIMTNGLCNFVNTSPFVTANNALMLVMEPDSALDTYETTKDWYSDSREGEPDVLEYLTGSGGAILLSYAASLLTPKIVSDISQYMMPYEVSYNRKYAVDETGQPLYEPDGVTRKTEKVSFSEAQIRKLTRNNFMLGGLMDMISGAVGADNVGWTAAEMPRQVITDSAQMACMRTLSVWDYENDVAKSPDEIAEVCTAIVMILDQNDDMKALYDEGFYLDSYTKQAVSEFIWDLYQQEIDEYNALVQAGGTNYYVVGNGDFNTGKEIVSRLNERHYAILSYYKNDLYYGKLRSDDLNQGLVRYNRYNTTYAQDRDGDWYATGFRQNMNPLMPFMTAPQEGTAGSEGSWASLSAVTGLGMYDQEGDPYRALVPYVEKNDQWVDWDELGGGNANGKSNNYPNWSSGGYGGYGSRGGGGGGGGGGYSRTAYANRGQGSSVYKAPYVNAHRSTGSHNVNFSRPNLSYILDGKRIYNANIDYLRPNFETKGSRESYKRGDF